jgi:hypothetical protein
MGMHEHEEQDEHNGASEETLPDTPLHAYGEGREEDVEGDVEALKSGDPDQLQESDVEGDDESDISPDPPPKD